jgi:hypothetical protein
MLSFLPIFSKTNLLNAKIKRRFKTDTEKQQRKFEVLLWITEAA